MKTENLRKNLDDRDRYRERVTSGERISDIIYLFKFEKWEGWLGWELGYFLELNLASFKSHL